MTKIIEMHPSRPSMKDIMVVVQALEREQLILYPTDAGYALGALCTARSAHERIRRLRKLPPKKPLSLIVKDVSQASQFAQIGDAAYRVLKQATPGPFTFILPSTKSAPKQARCLQQKTVGIRISTAPLLQSLVAHLSAPMMTTSFMLEDVDDVSDWMQSLQGHVDYLLWSDEHVPDVSTTVVDLCQQPVQVIRLGAGDPQCLGCPWEMAQAEA